MNRKIRKQLLMKAPLTLWDLLVNGRYEFKYDLMPIRLRRLPLKKRINLIKAGFNLFHRKLHPWSRPINMQVELTNFCNLKCPVCPIGTGDLRRNPKAMEPELLERLLDEWGQYLLTIALFAWGEPLLHPQLKQMLSIASRYTIPTRLSTNGQNLNDERVIDALITHPPTYLIVALDGLTDVTNARFRVGATLSPALAGVRRLQELKKKNNQSLPILHMRYIVMKSNQHELPRVKAFAKAHHFDILTIRLLNPRDINDGGSFDQLIPDIKKYDSVKEDTGNEFGFICDYPFLFPTMLADGTLVACDHDYNGQCPIMVATPDTSFDELWFSKKTSAARKMIRDHPCRQSFCSKCPYPPRETGSCSVEVFILNPSFEVPPVG